MNTGDKIAHLHMNMIHAISVWAKQVVAAWRLDQGWPDGIIQYRQLSLLTLLIT